MPSRTILYKIPILRTFLRNYRLTAFKKKWRAQNRHNRTVAMNEFPTSCVTVGKGTYGELHILSYYPQIEKLRIGNYVSIAPNVHFILGGNHQSETLFTYPIRSTLLHRHCPEDAGTKGAISIEDEVWIGYGSLILSGVTIGKGAIIGAGTVVTKDIPPFCIAAGNPARILKKRFSDEVISKIKDLSLHQFSEQSWEQHLDTLYTPIHSIEECQQVINKLKNESNNE